MTGSLRPEWSPTASDALVGLFGDGIDAPTIALMLKRPERVVRAELARRGGEALWRPRCMSDEEYASWAEKNAPMTSGKATRPCSDCPMGYAADMRAEGRCNGTPGGVEEDEGEMALPTSLPQLRPGAVAAPPAARIATDVAARNSEHSSFASSWIVSAGCSRGVVTVRRSRRSSIEALMRQTGAWMQNALRNAGGGLREGSST